ncbi:hypothetical protein D3C80_460370 [compost metagenome]
MVGIEVLVQQVGAGAIDQHQLAELLQLVLGREGGDLYHGGVLLAHLEGADDKVLLDLCQSLVIPYRLQAGQLQLGVLPPDARLQYPEGGVARIAQEHGLGATGVADVIVALQADPDMDHQIADLVMGQPVGGLPYPLRDGGQGDVVGEGIVLLDVVRQRVVAAYLVFDPQQHGTYVGLQVGPQLRVGAQIIGVVLVDVGQQMLHQLLALGGHGRAELGSIGSEPGLDLDGEAGDLLLPRRGQGRQLGIDVAGHRGQGLGDVVAGKLAQLVACRLTQQGDGAVDGELLQALVGEAQLMAAELIVNVVAHDLQGLAGAEGGQQALQRVVVQQLLAQQLGQAGADRRLAPLNAHAQPWLALYGEPEVGEPLPHLCHVSLQGRPAQIPGIRQLVELDPLLRRQQQDLQMQHPLATGARQAALLLLCRQQRIKQSLIVNLELIAGAALVDQVGTLGGDQLVEGRHVGAYRAGGDIEATGQLLLGQRLGMELGQQLMEPGVGQLDHGARQDSCCEIKGRC